MKFLDSIFHRGERKLTEQLNAAIMLSTAQGEAHKTDAEVMWREQLGTNYELLHDDDVEEMLTEAMYKKAVVIDPATGKAQIVRRAQIDFDMAALRMIVSHVNRASFMSPSEADIMKIKLRAVIKRIKMQMRPDLYNLGISNFLKGVEIWVNFMLSDAIDGRKAKLTKTIPKITRLEVETGKLEKKGPI